MMTKTQAIPSDAQLNWYLFEPSQQMFTHFWAHIQNYLAKYGYQTRPALYYEGQSAISLTKANRLMLGQMCGVTFSKRETDRPNYLSSFVLDDPDLKPGYYRSVIVTSQKYASVDIASLPLSSLRAAISEPDSFSGCFALYQALQGDFLPASFASSFYTGGHMHSLNAVATGQADIAAIDCLTWRILQVACPEQVESVHIAGYSAQMPGPPLVSALAADSLCADYLAKAISSAFEDKIIRAQMQKFGIMGTLKLDLVAYDAFSACHIL